MQNNPRKQDIIQELRGKRQDVTELCKRSMSRTLAPVLLRTVSI